MNGSWGGNNLVTWGSTFEVRASAQVTSGVEVWNAGLECLFVCSLWDYSWIELVILREAICDRTDGHVGQQPDEIFANKVRRMAASQFIEAAPASPLMVGFAAASADLEFLHNISKRITCLQTVVLSNV